MIRALLIIFLVSLFWLMLKVFFRVFGAYFTLRQLFGQAQKEAKKKKETEKMVKCLHCALHVPESEAYLENDLTFCCKAHADTYHKENN